MERPWLLFQRDAVSPPGTVMSQSQGSVRTHASQLLPCLNIIAGYIRDRGDVILIKLLEVRVWVGPQNDI